MPAREHDPDLSALMTWAKKHNLPEDRLPQQNDALLYLPPSLQHSNNAMLLKALLKAIKKHRRQRPLPARLKYIFQPFYKA